ncbi:MAG: hypothetical protein KGN33_18015 [Paracoccaceae bacterium]|nr:hypothetical protein [Paracoccaceae bacterium]
MLTFASGVTGPEPVALTSSRSGGKFRRGCLQSGMLAHEARRIREIAAKDTAFKGVAAADLDVAEAHLAQAGTIEGLSDGRLQRLALLRAVRLMESVRDQLKKRQRWPSSRKP